MCVSCAVGTESLYIIDKNSIIQTANMANPEDT